MQSKYLRRTRPIGASGAITIQKHTTKMGIIASILIGLLVGAVAKLLMPGRDPGGWIVTILLGLAGSFVAHFIGRGLGWYREGDAAGFIASVVGAIILLVLYRLVARKPS